MADEVFTSGWQLDTLADVYQVPRWVLLTDELPAEYRYANKPSFRKFKGSKEFDDYKVRQVINRVEQYRDLFIELRQDIDDPLVPFKPPAIKNSKNSSDLAQTVRNWLSIDSSLNFAALKEKLEQQGIFIFLTSKYKGWSHVDKALRGIAVTHDTMPIIIINNSDSKKAQSFTLMHELGHLLRGDTSIDGDSTEDSDVEGWCDQFAGEFLMEAKLQAEYPQLQKKRKESKEYPARDRPKEVCEQFGTGFVNTVLTTWHHQKITLHKALQLLDLKNPGYIHGLQRNLSRST